MRGLDVFGRGRRATAWSSHRPTSGRPQRYRRPAMIPSTPQPVDRDNVGRNLRGGPPRRAAPRPPGAQTPARAPPPATGTRRILRPDVATAASRTRPVVKVPVLSSTTCVTRESASIASARTASICLRPSAPAAAASADGVASDSAHGHETTSTAKATISAREASTCHQNSAVPRRRPAARRRTTPATLSASLPMRGLASRPARRAGERAANAVAAPAAVTRTIKRALAIDRARQHRVAAGLAPAASSRRSAALLRRWIGPSTTSPSAGRRPPAAMRTMSPATSSRPPPSRPRLRPDIRATAPRSAATRGRPPRWPSPARCRARSSNQRATSSNATNIVTESK